MFNRILSLVKPFALGLAAIAFIGLAQSEARADEVFIAGNTAANGAGDATGAPTPGPNVDGAVASNGHNLLGVATEATGFTGPGDQTNANPMLAPLADNGGPTQTMELLPGSPAIDAGNNDTCSPRDQRRVPRPRDGDNDGTSICDIGSFEY